ncbi:MAG: hypothetical protein Q4D38_08685 [Planctomycetia bacterium]|nr:hypothetical protein [Planctomycetia bacterium]
MNRGGSWNNNAENCRSANRNNNDPTNSNNNVGFRLLFVPQLRDTMDVASLNRKRCLFLREARRNERIDPAGSFMRRLGDFAMEG